MSVKRLLFDEDGFPREWWLFASLGLVVVGMAITCVCQVIVAMRS